MSRRLLKLSEAAVDIYLLLPAEASDAPSAAA
jgi:hypothetical protein